MWESLTGNINGGKWFFNEHQRHKRIHRTYRTHHRFSNERTHCVRPYTLEFGLELGYQSCHIVIIALAQLLLTIRIAWTDETDLRQQ